MTAQSKAGRLELEEHIKIQRPTPQDSFIRRRSTSTSNFHTWTMTSYPIQVPITISLYIPPFEYALDKRKIMNYT